MNKTYKINTFLFCPVATLTSLVYHRFLKFFIQILNCHRDILNCKNFISPYFFIILQAPHEQKHDKQAENRANIGY